MAERTVCMLYLLILINIMHALSPVIVVSTEESSDRTSVGGACGNMAVILLYFALVE
jgi:hypothetical protein